MNLAAENINYMFVWQYYLSSKHLDGDVAVVMGFVYFMVCVSGRSDCKHPHEGYKKEYVYLR